MPDDVRGIFDEIRNVVDGMVDDGLVRKEDLPDGRRGCFLTTEGKAALTLAVRCIEDDYGDLHEERSGGRGAEH